MASVQTTRAGDNTASVPAWVKWSETSLLTLIMLGFGFWYRPEDPFYLESTVPWPVLAPLLAGLRYGFLAALVSSVCLLLAAAFKLQINELHEFPWGWAAGILSLSLLAGEFRDYWGRRLARTQAVNDYLDRRLNEFTRDFYLMKVSHDRLEQHLAASSRSLREALRGLYSELEQSGAYEFNEQSAGLMLNLLAGCGQLQTAAIYRIEKGQCGAQPLAAIGDFGSLKSDDPILVHALEQETLVSVQTEFRTQMAHLHTELLLALPFTDSGGEMQAICLVKAMPFFSFQPRVLRLLAILAGHMADIITQYHVAGVDTDPKLRALMFHATRAGHDAEQFQLPAMAFGLFTANQNAITLLSRIERLRRGLDVFAFTQDAQTTRVVLLMPLTDELGFAGYLKRLEDDLTNQTGSSLHDLASTETFALSDAVTTIAWIRKFMATDNDHE